MLDPAFTTPAYDDKFRRIFEFAQYADADHSNFWIELDYYINRDSFTSRIGEALDTEIVSFGGEKIFRDALDKSTIAARSMVVIKETVEPQTIWQDIYKVTELYGYAPAKTFESYTSQIVRKFGTNDPSGYLQVSSRCGTFDYVDSTDSSAHLANAFFGGLDLVDNVFILPFATTAEISDFAIGDSVMLNMPKHIYSNWTYYELETSYTTIFEKGTTSTGRGYLKLAACDGFLKSNGESIGASDIGQFLKGYPSLNNYDIPELNKNQYFRRPFKLTRLKKMIRPSSRVVSVRQQITYLSDVPASLEQKFQPLSGDGSETETIDEFSTPSISLYKKLRSGTATAEEISSINGIIGSGEYLIEDATIQNINTCYKKILKYAKLP